jgi:hypothetical protein
MNNIKFICVQPDDKYFHWQVEVFINNAVKVGINPNSIQIIFSFIDLPSREGADLIRMYPFVRFFFYKRTRRDNYGYIPILRPDALRQHFKRFPELSEEVIFYHDSDIIFRELPDFTSLISDDVWYLSDTVSYIGAKYIRSKSDKIFTDMCEIAGVSEDLIDSNNDNSGGAQYLMKGIDSDFWGDVEFLALDLYKYMLDSEDVERQSLGHHELKMYNPIQKWCADMWAVLWCGLRRGETIRISTELGFSWGSSPGMEEWNKHKIMHNAGITNSAGGKLFYKGEYIDKSPWGVDFSNIEKNHNTYNYVQAIMYADKMRKLNSLPR